MQYLPYAPTCPPLRGYERTSTGFALWLSLERGLKVTKNGKPCQERPSRCRCPRGRQNRRNKKPTKERPRGQNQTRQKQKGGQKNTSNPFARFRVFSACVQRAKRTKRKKRKDVHYFCRSNGCKNY